MASNTVLVSVPAGRGAAFVARAVVRVRGPGRAHPGGADAGLLRRPGHLPRRVALLGRVQHPQRQRRNYVLTAGHCTDLGGTWTTSSGQTIGPVAASSFPGNDYGAIRISNPASLDPRGGVLHNGAFRDITGAGRVPVGSQACRAGSTTGTTCGTVQAYNVTVNYAEGTVFGLTGPTSVPSRATAAAPCTPAAWPRASPPAAPSAAAASRASQLLPAGRRGAERVRADTALTSSA